MTDRRQDSWTPTVMLADADRRPVTEVDELREVNKAIRRQLVDQENTIRQLRAVILELRQNLDMVTR